MFVSRYAAGEEKKEAQAQVVNPPLHDALVGADDGGLDVDGVVPHPPQLHGLLQRAHHEQGVVPLWRHKGTKGVGHVGVDGPSRQRRRGGGETHLRWRR